MARLLSLVLCAYLACVTLAADLSLPLSTLTLPPGFEIELYSQTSLPAARSLRLSSGDNDGATIVYVSSNAQQVYALVDFESDGIADTAVTLINSSDYSTPLGIAWEDGSLYVATPTQVYRFDDADDYVMTGKPFGSPDALIVSLPTNNSDHTPRYIGIGPDGLLYINIGAPCNVCPLDDWETTSYGSINTFDLTDANATLVRWAQGVRNSVGFDWHPDTQELWFTSNGRDDVGDNVPDDPLDTAPVRGIDFGFPYCGVQGNGDPEQRSLGPGQIFADPDVLPPAPYNASLGARIQYCTGQEQPVQALGPHVAAIGMRFYEGTQFPAEYNRSIFIAEHGSWDRTPKIGYRVANVQLDEEGTPTNHTVFISGWLDDATQDVWGRPADVLVLPDGSMLVSDDTGNAVYRVTYNAAGATGSVSQASVST